MERLSEIYKGKFPFRLGSTSFIYPDLYSENVKALGPFIDEIELLFFEGIHPDSIPDEYELQKLLKLKQELNLTYNIHLPTDVSIASPAPTDRRYAVDVVSKVIQKTSILEPVTYTLHIPYEEYPGGDNVWKAYAFKGLRTLLENGMDPKLLSIETLDYSPELLSDILQEFDVSMCFDIGHLILYGYDPLYYYTKYKERISIIHLHGVYKGCDHVAIDLMDEDDFKKIREILVDFHGSLSIEVFSFNELKSSLNFLNENLDLEKIE